MSGCAGGARKPVYQGRRGSVSGKGQVIRISPPSESHIKKTGLRVLRDLQVKYFHSDRPRDVLTALNRQDKERGGGRGS